MNFDELKQCVNFDKGYIGIAFKDQSEERREQIFNGTTGDERNNAEIADALLDKKNSKSGGWLASLLPYQLILLAIQGYTATLKYRHCELVLYLSPTGKARWGEDKILGVGLNSVQGVFILPRRYNTEYEWQHVTCNRASMLAMLHFAWTQRHKKFSLAGMTQLTIWPGPDDRTGYYCAHFTMACLEFLPFYDFHINPCNKMTIDDVYDLVIRKEHTPATIDEVTRVQFKRQFGDDAFVGPPLRVDDDTRKRLESGV